MKVLGSRLVITCKKCGRDVVAVGGEPGPAVSQKSAADGGRVLELDEEEVVQVGAAAAREEADAAPAGASEVVAPDPETALPQAAPSAPPPAEPLTAVSPSLEPARPEVPAPAFSAAARFPKGAPASPAPPSRSKAVPVIAAVCVAAGAAVVFSLSSSRRPESKQPVPAKVSAPTPAVPAASPAAAPTPEPTPAVTPAAAQAGSKTGERASFDPKPTPRATAVKPTVPVKGPAGSSGVRSESDALAAGTIDREAFEDRAAKIVTHARLCARLEQSRNLDVRLGTIGVSVVVGPSGAVTRVSLDKPALDSSPFGSCLREQLKKLTFPPFPGAPVEIRRTVSLDSAPGA